jgi:hypothetical protein
MGVTSLEQQGSGVSISQNGGNYTVTGTGTFYLLVDNQTNRQLYVTIIGANTSFRYNAAANRLRAETSDQWVQVPISDLNRVRIVFTDEAWNIYEGDYDGNFAGSSNGSSYSGMTISIRAKQKPTAWTRNPQPLPEARKGDPTRQAPPRQQEQDRERGRDEDQPRQRERQQPRQQPREREPEQGARGQAEQAPAPRAATTATVNVRVLHGARLWAPEAVSAAWLSGDGRTTTWATSTTAPGGSSLIYINDDLTSYYHPQVWGAFGPGSGTFEAGRTYSVTLTPMLIYGGELRPAAPARPAVTEYRSYYYRR